MTPAELRAAMSALPYPETDKQPPHWEFWRAALWNHVVGGDDPNQFMDWPPIYHCMLVSHWGKAIAHEFSLLPDDSIWIDAISRISPDSEKDEFVWHKYEQDISMNLIHQAYHLHRFQKMTGKKISDMETIVEIGGGYGAMCLVARRLGFKGKYVIYDLPEFSLFQQWYLSQVGIEGVEFASKLPKKDARADLVIGLYSLSEMEIDLRLRLLLSKYGGHCDNFLFLYSGQWVDFDNVKFFQESMPNLMNDLSWQHEEITHLPDRNNWYSFGWNA